MWVKKQQLEPNTEQRTGSKLGKEYVKAVYCHPAYLTSMQSTSCKMLVWMKHKLESGLLGEISATSDVQVIPLYCQKVKRREPVAEGEKDGLKLNIKKTKITASGTITSWQSLFLWAPKSVQTVTAAMKLKDTCSLEEKL